MALAQEVETLSWFSTRTVQNTTVVNSWRSELDAGEAEAIALALEIKADLLLMDERRGCMIAPQMEVECNGVLGVLIEAKHQGLIAAVKPILDDLIAIAGFWVDNALYRRILQTVNEDNS
jgi:predicted nucleic acid-binding protein